MERNPENKIRRVPVPPATITGSTAEKTLGRDTLRQYGASVIDDLYEVLLNQLARTRGQLEEYSRDANLEDRGQFEEAVKSYRISPQQIIDQGLEYLKMCLDTRTRPTIFGLCCWLGISYDVYQALCGKQVQATKQGIMTDKYIYPLQTLRSFIAMCYEMAGQVKRHPAFEVFLLKNMGLNEKTEQQPVDGSALFDAETRKIAQQRLHQIGIPHELKEN